MNKILKIISITILTTLLVACSALPKYVTHKNINDKVYVVPHKPLEVPKMQGKLEFPEYNSQGKTPTNYIVESNSQTDLLVAPPEEYAQPANTAPIGVLGEDEELKQLHKQVNPNATPSKKSIWGDN